MKRYIRLRNGQLFDTTKNHIKKEEWAFESSLEILKNGHIYYYFTKDIIVESDNVLGLIQVGDLVFNNYGSLIQVTDVMFVSLCANNCYVQKLYTKQGDNYILVWDKEKRVI